METRTPRRAAAPAAMPAAQTLLAQQQPPLRVSASQPMSGHSQRRPGSRGTSVVGGSKRAPQQGGRRRRGSSLVGAGQKHVQRRALSRLRPAPRSSATRGGQRGVGSQRTLMQSTAAARHHGMSRYLPENEPDCPPWREPQRRLPRRLQLRLVGAAHVRAPQRPRSQQWRTSALRGGALRQRLAPGRQPPSKASRQRALRRRDSLTGQQQVVSASLAALGNPYRQRLANPVTQQYPETMLFEGRRRSSAEEEPRRILYEQGLERTARHRRGLRPDTRPSSGFCARTIGGSEFLVAVARMQRPFGGAGRAGGASHDNTGAVLAKYLNGTQANSLGPY